MVSYSPSSWDVSQNKTKIPHVPAAALRLPYVNYSNRQQLNEEFEETEAQSVGSQLVKGRGRKGSQRGAQEPTFLTTAADSSRLGLGSFLPRTREIFWVFWAVCSQSQLVNCAIHVGKQE